MDRWSLSEDPVEELGGMLAEITRECLRGKCCELSMFLVNGVEAPLLLEEIEDLARDAWALRTEDDT
jgi:hypothetical protein